MNIGYLLLDLLNSFKTKAIVFLGLTVAFFAFAGNANAAITKFDILSPNGGEYIRGVYTIKWDCQDDGVTPKCSDTTISNIVYSTDGGASYTETAVDDNTGSPYVANSLSASVGSFSWRTTANTESNQGRIKVIMNVTSGPNGDNDESDANFTVDNTDPQVTQTETLDTNNDGVVDHIKVTIDDGAVGSGMNTCEAGGWSVTDNDGNTTSVLVNSCTVDSATQITLAVTPATPDDFLTDSTPAVQYTQGSHNNKDAAGNELADYGPTDATDGAAPAPLSAEIIDHDGDGILDLISVTFSEAMPAKIGNNTTGASDTFSVSSASDFAITSANDGLMTDGNKNGNADSTPLNVVSFLFTTTSKKTDVGDLKLQFGTTDGAVVSGTNIKDASGNEAVGFTLDTSSNPAIEDAAAPVIVSVAYQNADTTTTDVDKISVTYTEDISLNEYDSGDWTITAGSPDDLGVQEETNAVVSGSNGNVIELTVDWADNVTGSTGSEPSLTYTASAGTANSVHDGNGNSASDQTVTMADDTKPVILSITTLDLNSDGKVDAADLVFSENIDYSTFSPSEFTIGGVTVDSLDNIDGTDDDANIRLKLNNANEVAGTDAKDVTFTNDGDTKGLDGNNVTDVTSADITEIDGAGPAIVSAKSISTTEVEVTFSENLDGATVDTTDFVLDFADSNADGNPSVVTGSNNVYTLTVPAGAIGVDETTGTAAFSAQNVTNDNNSNGNTQTTTVTVNDGIAPSFVKAWEYDTDGDGNIDEIVVELDEAVDDSTVTASDFTLGAGSVTGFSSSSSGNVANTLDTADNDKYITLEVNVPGTAAVSVAYTQGTLEDVNGNLAATDASIATDDQAKPVITINVPTANQAFNSLPITLDITTSETANCKYQVDGTAPGTYSDASLALMTNTNALNHTQDVSPTTEGAHTAYFVCQDVSANANESSVENKQFIYDITTPDTVAVDAEDNKEVGEEVVITAQTSDALTNIYTAHYKITNLDTGDVYTGIMSATDGSFDSLSEGLSASVDTGGWTAGNYKVLIYATDSSGSGNVESEDENNVDTFTLKAASDITAPVISSVSAVPAQTTATITWATDENATSQVEYGLTGVYGNVTADDTSADNTTHSVTITGLACGTTYHYRVISRDAAGNLAQGSDKAFTTTACSVDTTPPAGSVSTTATTVNADFYVITGTLTADSDNVTITINNGSADVASTVVTAGNTSWSVTVPLPQNTATTFTAKATDASANTATLGSVVITEDSSLGVDTTPPAGSVSTTATTVNADFYVITGTLTADSDNVTITINNGSADVASTVVTAGNTSWSVTVPLPQNTATTFTAKATDASANTATLGSVVITEDSSPVDITPPVISSISTDKPEYRKTQDPNVAVTIVEDDTAVTVTVNGVNATEGSAGVWTYSFAHPGVEGTYSVVVVATDAAGNVSSRTISYNVVADDAPDTQAPIVLSTTPTTGAVNVSVSAGAVTVKFDENVTIADQTKIKLIKVSDGSSVKNGNATVAGDTLSIPYNTLEYGTAYKVMLEAGAVQDNAGNATTLDTVVYFTTQDVTAPVITQLYVDSITSTGAIINWGTDVSVDSIEYRVSTQAYGGSYTSIVAGTNSGTINITGLNPSTTYYYTVRFIKNGKVAESVPVAFKTASADTGISVDSIQAVKTYAVADDTYANGWKWVFYITINDMAETNLAMKFDQWVNGTNTLDVANNMRYSIDGSNWVDITANSSYGNSIDVSAIDLDASRGGRQVKIYVEMKVPTGTVGGSYSTSYGIQTN